jgi:hypothetical protein
MVRKLRIGAVVSVLLLGGAPLQAQGVGHTFFIRGKIVRLDAGGAIACLGTADKAQVGQILEVYRTTPRRRSLVGHVEVDQIFDDHFAHIQVVDGTPRKGDWASMKRSR